MRLALEGAAIGFAGEEHIPLTGLNTDGSIYNGDNVNFFARAAGQIMPLTRSLNDEEHI